MTLPNGGFNWRSWQDTQEEALRSQRRAEAEDEQPFLDRVAEVGRELEEFNKEFTKKSPF